MERNANLLMEASICAATRHSSTSTCRRRAQRHKRFLRESRQLIRSRVARLQCMGSARMAIPALSFTSLIRLETRAPQTPKPARYFSHARILAVAQASRGLLPSATRVITAAVLKAIAWVRATALIAPAAFPLIRSRHILRAFSSHVPPSRTTRSCHHFHLPCCRCRHCHLHPFRR